MFFMSNLLVYLKLVLARNNVKRGNYFMSKEYKRSCKDELDWTDVEQLHAATLQISKSCFEYKKLCIGFLAGAMTFLIKFTDNAIDHSLFVVAILIIMGFWLADSTAYYYQRVIRNIMDKRMVAIADRNTTTDYNRKVTVASKLQALFNGSMTLYFVLMIIGIIGWISYGKDWIGV